MLLKEFLARVLPGEGYKCWVEITKRKKVLQGFVATVEELALKLADIDARGSDAYFACAAYKTPDNRQSHNALVAKAFWLDIDAGEGKPYADADAAIDACDEFCHRYDLPLPGIVRSGNGAHAYWILDRSLAPDLWQAAASRLKLLASAAGFHADQSRTADVASILRPPLTRNFKRPDTPRPVTLGSDDGWDAIDVTSFLEVLLAKTPPSSGQLAPKTINSPYVSAGNAALLAGISKAFDPSQGVAAGQRGSTQLKYAGELVAKGFDEALVLAKCRAWNQLCTPPQDDREVVRIVRSAFTMHSRKHPPVLPPEESFDLMKVKLPHGYRWNPANHQLEVEVEEPDAGGNVLPRWKVVSRYPVYLSGILKNEHGAGENSYLFCQYGIEAGWKEFAISSAGMNTQHWYASWFENGGTIQAGMDKYFKTYVRKAEDMFRDDHAIARYSQMGWKGDAFLVGDVLLKNGQPSKAYGTDKLTPLMRTMALPKEGSLEEWTAAANKFFAPGMEAHGFALLASFAAPLMRYCVGSGDGGAILSLFTEGSGNGKTPTTEAIASVWGDMFSTVMSATSTENSLMEAVVRHCHLPVVREEMNQGDPLIVANSIKRFTAGVDRERLNKDGSAKGEAERYQTILITASNLSLREIVAMADIPASRRIFEPEIKRPDKEFLSNLGGITREMMRCRGFAGRRWAQILTSAGVPRYLTEQLTGLTQEAPGSVVISYREALVSLPEHRYIVWLLASVHVAATLLVYYGVLHFDVARIMNWAIGQASDHTANADESDAPGKLQQFLGEHLTGLLIVTEPADTKNVVVERLAPKSNLIMRAEINTKRLYIAQDVIKKWCTKNRVAYVLLGRALAELGIVVARSKPLTLGAGTVYPSSRTYCWEINLLHPAMSGMLMEVRKPADIKTA